MPFDVDDADLGEPGCFARGRDGHVSFIFWGHTWVDVLSVHMDFLLRIEPTCGNLFCA